MKNKQIYISIVDDHALFRKGLSMLIDSIPSFNVLFDSANGKDFIRQLKPTNLPDVVLLDIRMPEFDGYETAEWITLNYPQIVILALSTMDDDTAIIKMIQKGAKGYVLKNADTDELKQAIHAVLENGYFYNESVTHKVMRSIGGIINGNSEVSTLINLNDREKEFLKLACTEMSYAEIAKAMFLSPRTIDGYREALFAKLNVKSRVGLVLYSIKHGVVQL